MNNINYLKDIYHFYRFFLLDKKISIKFDMEESYDRKEYYTVQAFFIEGNETISITYEYGDSPSGALKSLYENTVGSVHKYQEDIAKRIVEE